MEYCESSLAVTSCTMDPLQQDFERGVGDRFAEWLAHTSNETCTFLRRADHAPDLVYAYGGKELLVEVTAAYYDSAHAAFLWKGAKGAPDAPAGWSGVNPDKSLATAIAVRITSKSTKRYGANTILLIEVPPGVTSAERLEFFLSNSTLPYETPFTGIYVVGRFPITTESAGGYRVITVKPMAK